MKHSVRPSVACLGVEKFCLAKCILPSLPCLFYFYPFRRKSLFFKKLLHPFAQASGGGMLSTSYPLYFSIVPPGQAFGRTKLGCAGANRAGNNSFCKTSTPDAVLKVVRSPETPPFRVVCAASSICACARWKFAFASRCLADFLTQTNSIRSCRTVPPWYGLVVPFCFCCPRLAPLSDPWAPFVHF